MCVCVCVCVIEKKRRETFVYRELIKEDTIAMCNT